ncbi:MAG TPA: diguanylate cyclase [Candidatus Acidoferrales bacterium]|nr:diguanylate cyclase [Candidatus Acidoferrales bacterium]
MTVAAQTAEKILVAEDDPVSQRMLQSFLTKWGYEIIAVSSGTEALRVLESPDAPPLAVLDWMMPGLEGPEICREIRKDPERPYTYVLLLTARTQKEDLLRGLEAGADDYLTKPFDVQELRARLHVGRRILDLQHHLLAATDELRFRASHDMLTGIPNRGTILEAVNRERARQIRDGGSFGVILADLDHFKAVNDAYGHLAGDIVLKEAACRMRSCVRSYDSIGRYGGEEFLIVVPTGDGNSTAAVAERIREAISENPVITESGPISVTASLGIAVSFDREAKEVLRSADEALYCAKARGRNRVERFEVSMIPAGSPQG